MEQPCLHCKTPTTARDQFCCSACRLLYSEGWQEGARAKPYPSSYAAYEEENVRKLYDFAPAGRNPLYRFALEGLQCSSCVHLLEKLPQYLSQILSARVQFARSEIQVEALPSHSLPQILYFIEQMGYPARPLRPDENHDGDLKREDRDLLKRLAVAGACSGNIMLFSVAIYGGLAGELAQIFNQISLLLFLPILFYCVVPLYRSAWTSLKMRHLNVDAPLVVALWAGFIASAFNLVKGYPGIYFDSTAGFIFLILISRWFLRSSQRRWLGTATSQFPWMSQLVLKSSGGNAPASELRAGDRFFLKREQILPVDGVLISEKALFDTSWMTGESTPRICIAGMRIPAGYRVLGERTEIVAHTNVHESELVKGLRQAEQENLYSKSARLDLFDRIAQKLLVVVMTLGALTIMLAPLLGLTYLEGFSRALSLLIVACPCALAFGGPLAYAMAIRKATKAGVLIRNAEVLDRVAECKNLVLDKTGTLTEGKLIITEQFPQQLPDWIRDLILALEKVSNHPVAEAFRQAWADKPHHAIEVQDVHEVPGERLYGIFQGKLYSLQSSNTDSGGLGVKLLQEGQEIARFTFDDSVRAESRRILASLKSRFRISILSGDREDRVRSLIDDLKIPGVLGHGNARPREKADSVRIMNPCLMIGDGLNDGEALAAAHVGVAMKGSLENGLRQASVYFLVPGLNPLLDLLKASERARKLVRRNLAFALLYNIAAGAAALAGFINPLVAALLMPVSSILILLSTWEASR